MHTARRVMDFFFIMLAKKNLFLTVQDGLKNAPPIFENLGPLFSRRNGQETGSVYGLW